VAYLLQPDLQIRVDATEFTDECDSHVCHRAWAAQNHRSSRAVDTKTASMPERKAWGTPVATNHICPTMAADDVSLTRTTSHCAISNDGKCVRANKAITARAYHGSESA